MLMLQSCVCHAFSLRFCLIQRLDDVQARLKETSNEFESIRKRARKAKMEFEAVKKQRFECYLQYVLLLNSKK